MGIPRLPEIVCDVIKLLKEKEVFSVVIILVMLTAVIPDNVYAESFWDKVKAAAKKSQEQQQQKQQQTQQQKQQGTAQRQAAPTSANSTKIKSYDVRGISLGMSPAEVEKVLRKRYPGYHIIPINYTGYGTKWMGVLTAMPKTKHKDEVVLVDFAQPPLKSKVISITRYKEFPANATPSLENVEKGLADKYGKWTKADATTRAGYRKIYGWWTNQKSSSCINEKLSATFGRVKEIIEEDALSRVIGDAYGDPSQYITSFRQYADLNTQTPSCGKQVTAEINYRPDQNMSPVNKLITVVADFPAFYDSEVAFSKLVDDYQKQKTAGAVKKGGVPDL